MIFMTKTKLTLSVDKEILKSAKVYVSQHDTTISKEFEEFVLSLTGSNIMDKIMDRLGIKKQYVSQYDIIRNRNRIKGRFDSGKMIREMRDAREKAILGQ